jgi:AraC-like DNA-binding protein
MNIHIENFISAYSFQKNQDTWTNKAPRRLNIVSYQVEGQYDHTFSFGVLQSKKDCVFTINPNDEYSVQQIKPGHSICFIFTSNVPVRTEVIDCTNDPRFSILFRKLLQYQDLYQACSYYMALSIAYEILALIAEKQNMKYYQVSRNTPFLEVRDYLMNNFSDSSVDTSTMAAKYGFSDKYFRERFRGLFGSTPTQYLITLRLNEAARLLSNGTHNVKQAAEAVGFSDSNYFSRSFKQRVGCSPSDYRRRYKGSDT